MPDKDEEELGPGLSQGSAQASVVPSSLSDKEGGSPSMSLSTPTPKVPGCLY
jgi:hypothetical protein